MIFYAVKIASVFQRIPIKVARYPGSDKDHILRIGMSVVPTVLAR